MSQLKKTAHILTGWPNPTGVFAQGTSDDTKLKLGALVLGNFTLPNPATAALADADIFVMLNSVGDADTSPDSPGDAENVTIGKTGTLTAFKLTDDVTFLTSLYDGDLVAGDTVYQDNTDGLLKKAEAGDNKVVYLRVLEAPKVVGSGTYLKVGAIRGGGKYLD